MSAAPHRIVVAAALVMHADGRTLLVRKRGTTAFMQPGGKPEPGETAREALRRELREEVGLDVPDEALRLLGCFTAPAANEAGCLVDATVFRVDAPGEPAMAAEIAEMVWVRPAEALALPLAPLTRDHVLPLAGAAGTAEPTPGPCA